MRKTAVGGVAAALVLLVPSSALASTTIGSTAPPTGSCTGPGSAFVLSRPDAVPVTMPTDGVITSWSYHAAATGSPAAVSLRVVRATGPANVFKIVADAANQTVPPDGQLHTYPTRITVREGDYIGLQAPGSAPCSTALAGAQAMSQSGALTAGQTATFTAAGGLLMNMAAALEPDADHDGFGDETQDPNTLIKGKPKKNKKVSKLRFSSTIPGSTFSCSIDGSIAKTCKSPAKYVCLPTGKHVFTVAAVSPAGATDSTPARKQFRVGANRPGC